MTETGGKARETLSKGKRRRAEETREKQEEESTQAKPRDGKMLGKMQTLSEAETSLPRLPGFGSLLKSITLQEVSPSEVH